MVEVVAWPRPGLATTAPRRQRGVAMITVLLVFAVATVIAAELLQRNFFSMRRALFQIEATQAHHYALGAEQFARQVLYRDVADSEQATPVDHPDEGWANTGTPFEYEGGQLAFVIHDLNGRFNLNSVVDAGGTVNSANLQQFRRLLLVLGLDTELATALVDWIDADGAPQGFGTEDNGYLSRDPAYRAANGPLRDVSELRWLVGMDGESYRLLRPHVAALPTSDNRINVNTASGAVLASLSDRLTLAAGDKLAEQRPEGGYASAADFLALPVLAGTSIQEQQLQVHGEYFAVRIQADYQQRSARLRTVLRRDPQRGVIELLARAPIPFFTDDNNKAASPQTAVTTP